MLFNLQVVVEKDRIGVNEIKLLAVSTAIIVDEVDREIGMPVRIQLITELQASFFLVKVQPPHSVNCFGL